MNVEFQLGCLFNGTGAKRFTAIPNQIRNLKFLVIKQKQESGDKEA
jgi:hypothetical protein